MTVPYYEVNESFINPIRPTSESLAQLMNSQLMDKYLFIGIVCLACGAWNMSKFSKRDGFWTGFISGMINMMAFAAGVAAIGYYAVSKGWYT